MVMGEKLRSEDGRIGRRRVRDLCMYRSRLQPPPLASEGKFFLPFFFQPPLAPTQSVGPLVNSDRIPIAHGAVTLHHLVPPGVFYPPTTTSTISFIRLLPKPGTVITERLSSVKLIPCVSCGDTAGRVTSAGRQRVPKRAKKLFPGVAGGRVRYRNTFDPGLVRQHQEQNIGKGQYFALIVEMGQISPAVGAGRVRSSETANGEGGEKHGHALDRVAGGRSYGRNRQERPIVVKLINRVRHGNGSDYIDQIDTYIQTSSNETGRGPGRVRSIYNQSDATLYTVMS